MDKNVYLKEVRRIFSEAQPTGEDISAGIEIGELNTPTRVLCHYSEGESQVFVETILNGRILAFIARRWQRDKCSVNIVRKPQDMRSFPPLRIRAYKAHEEKVAMAYEEILPALDHHLQSFLLPGEYILSISFSRPDLLFRAPSGRIIRFDERQNTISNFGVWVVSLAACKDIEYILSLQKKLVANEQTMASVRELFINLNKQMDAYSWMTEIVDKYDLRVGYLGEKMQELTLLEGVDWGGTLIAYDTLTDWRRTHA